MRKLIIALTATAGLGLFVSSGTAAPVSGAAIDTAANATAAVLQVRGGWHCPPRRCWKWKCHKVWRTQR